MRLFFIATFVLGLLSQAVSAQENFRLLRLAGDIVKWGEPAYGADAEVTYGFATQSVDFPDAINCREIDPMDRMAKVSGVSRTHVEQIAARAFRMWSGAAGIRFRLARRGETPDILIGAQARPRAVAWANVWQNASASTGGLAPIRRALICLNPEESWSIDASTPPGAYDLLTVLAHEIGHTIGLDHPGPRGALMGFQNQGRIRGLLPGDIRGANALYGPSR